MSKAVTVGTTALFACVLFATPLSLRLSPEGNLLPSTDTASAEIGRPLTPGSVAGVHRRAERRAYRRGYYGGPAADSDEQAASDPLPPLLLPGSPAATQVVYEAYVQ